MSNVRFISDLHLGHKNICKFSGEFRGGCTDVEQHDAWIVEQWNSVVAKNDLVWILGDICFDREKLKLFKKMKGNKHLILGNHDGFGIEAYTPYFNKIHGFLKFKGAAWLSHAPINTAQLRDKWNLHGHVHQNSLQDLRYINCCVEVLNGKPVSWTDLQTIMDERRLILHKDDAQP